MAGLTYDSGALIAAERNDRRLWALHARALNRGVIPVVPVVVLAQAWRGGPQALLDRLLGGCHLEPMSASAARAAGVALARSGTADAPDAAVVISAVRRQDAVVSSDRNDLLRIGQALGQRLSVIDI